MTMKKMIETYESVLEIPERITNIQNSISKIWNEMYSWRPRDAEEKHFVMILMEAERVSTVYSNETYPSHISPEIKKVERCNAAQSKYITDSSDGLFRIQPDFSMRRIRFTVICDITKVKIDLITVANVSLSPTYENAPTAFYEGEISPANRISIQCSVR